MFKKKQPPAGPQQNSAVSAKCSVNTNRCNRNQVVVAVFLDNVKQHSKRTNVFALKGQMKSVYVSRCVNVMIMSASSVSIRCVDIKLLNFVHRSFKGKIYLYCMYFFIPSVCSKKLLFSDWRAFPAALQCQERPSIMALRCKPPQLVLLFCFFFFFILSGWLFDHLFDIQPGRKVNSFVLD